MSAASPYLLSKLVLHNFIASESASHKLTILSNRILDPIFALTIGLSAAAMRIRREQSAKDAELRSWIKLGQKTQNLGWKYWERHGWMNTNTTKENS